MRERMRSLPHCCGMNRRQQFVRCALVGWLLSCTQITAAGVKIDIEGLDEELEAQARNLLELQQYADRPLSPAQANRLFAKAQDEIRKALEPFGYYHAGVEGDLERTGSGDYVARFRVAPGEPVTVNRAEVVVEGSAAELAAVKDALAKFEPKLGERLDHGAYERSKSNITTALQANGYFDAQLERHRVAVLRSAKSADIDLKWASGERYRFGDVTFSDVQFPEEFLQRFVPWEPHGFYSADDLLALQQRLVDADYFSSVSVQPDLERKSDGSVPIEATLVPAKRTIYTARVHVSTDSGPGVRFGVERRWLNDRGHKAGVELEYSQRLESYSAFYRIPRPGRRNRNYNIAVGYRDEETDTSTSRMARVAASEVLDEWHGFTRTLGLQYLNGDFVIADEQSSTSMLYAEALLTRKRADDLLFPTRGVSLLYGVRLAAESLLSETSFAQVRAEAKWIRPATEKSRLIFRAAIGGMVVDDFDALPPGLRFFAGGDRSIRGFGYEAIGETNDRGGVIGGKYLAVASAEYEYYFLPNWGVAAFVDAGDAYSASFDTNVGAGIGLRWRSPVGLLRVDIATPVVSDLDNGIQLHIMIGPDL
jgi:translocation and assembly module TamA